MNKTAVIVLVVLLGIGALALIMTMDDSEVVLNEAMEQRTDTQVVVEEEKEEGVMVGGAMMVRDLDIVENAMKANNVTTLVTAVAAAGLVDTLKGTGPFTVFAPTNAAFEKLPAGTVATLLMPANKADLSNILTYHVVPGRYTSADLKNGMELTTVQGKKLMIGNVNGKITVNGKASVETKDVISSNGVTFVIDTVLMPPTE
jgi:uncharacterized surface protein with fasciclin (FAS1) repeats